MTYEQVRQLISFPPDKRRDFDINSLLPWFQKRSEVFKNLKSKLLLDVIKNLHLIEVEQDEIVIRQGNTGDCMYIILGGQVTIYNNDATKRIEDEDEDEDGGKQSVANAVAASSSVHSNESVRQQLGNFVTTLKSGSAFGEVALMSDDCIRSASVVADGRTDLLVIGRELYNRSIKSVLKAEFDQKTDFVQRDPHFGQLSPKYKKQLAMALEKDSLPYEGVLTKQGTRIDAVYFILSGEVKVVMDVDQHSTQYPNLIGENDLYTQLRLNDNKLQPTRTSQNSQASNNYSGAKKHSRKTQKIGICLLGVNEAIGDIEVLLGLNTYMQTCVCTQPTEVLVLGMKHYDRLFARRNPRIIAGMRGGIALRLTSRMSNQKTSSGIPLMIALRDKAIEIFNAAAAAASSSSEPGGGTRYRRRSIERPTARGAAKKKREHSIRDPITENDHRRLQQKHSTSFEISRRRTKQLQLKAGHRSQNVVVSSNLVLVETPEQKNGDTSEAEPATASAAAQVGDTAGSRGSGYYSESLAALRKSNTDLALEKLERKMSEWMTGDSDSHNRTTTTNPRITRMHRNRTEMEQKQGARVRIRPKKFSAESFQINFETEQESTDFADLAYYKMALTASLPAFDNDDDEENEC